MGGSKGGVSRRQTLIGLAAGAVGLANRAKADQAGTPLRLTAAPSAWPLRPPPAAPTPIWAYDATPTGPVLHARQGSELRLLVDNHLPQSTSLHAAGMRVPNGLDGIAGLTGGAIAPGQAAELILPTTDAGFFTFGPGDPASAAEQNARGLGGALIVADPKDPAVDADIVLLIRDWLLDDDGAIAGGFDDRAVRVGPGRLGNVLTIGGLGEPRRLALAPGARFRLRIANTSNARIVPLKFEDLAPTLIGVSGQQSAVFTPLHGELLLLPGGRFDLVCTVPAGGVAPRQPRLMAAIGDGLPLLAVTVADEPPASGLPEIGWLSDNGLPAFIDLAHATRVSWTASLAVDPRDAKALAAADPARLWRVNGRAGDFAGPPLFSVRRGAPVVVALANASDVPIVAKLNGHVARLLHPRDDGWAPYWVDVVLIAPRATERIAFVAENPGRWLLGGRIFEHLAGGQFGWFEVS